MDLSIIIVNYKNKKKLESCLASIFKADNQDLNYEIIFVKNFSGEVAQESFNRFSLLRIFYLAKYRHVRGEY